MNWFKVGAAICFLAVVLGAFGAHALRATLTANDSRAIWNTAVLYQFLHGLALIMLSTQDTNRFACYFFIAGIVLFSGSLYALAATHATWLGAITPLGGICFLIGWGSLFFSSR
jgi:uncharacterized membrane protein YgdD (TMEM256/DUF423 family)